MNEISISELYELYLNTLNRCGRYLLEADDETIEYEIFEEFGIEVVTFLHSNSLTKLLNAGLISNKKMAMSSLLRNKIIDLQNTNEWTLVAFRNSPNWKNIFEICDELKSIT